MKKVVTQADRDRTNRWLGASAIWDEIRKEHKRIMREGGIIVKADLESIRRKLAQIERLLRNV